MMNKLSYLIKRYPFRCFLSGLVVLFVGFIAANNIYHATKIKDINDPRFDPMAYRFEDYIYSSDNRKVLEHMFPVGTPKERVDRILVEKLGANVIKDKRISVPENGYALYYKVSYNPLLTAGPSIKFLFRWLFIAGGNSISIIYDKNNHLIEIKSMIP